jgi:two-component sensor histidine kinase
MPSQQRVISLNISHKKLAYMFRSTSVQGIGCRKKVIPRFEVHHSTQEKKEKKKKIIKTVNCDKIYEILFGLI